MNARWQVARFPFAVLLLASSFPASTSARQADSHQAEIERIREAGEPAEIADLNPHCDIAVENDTAQCLGLIRASVIAINVAVEGHFEQDEPPSQEFREAWTRAVKEQGDVFEQLAQASRVTEWYPDLDYEATSARAFVENVEVDARSLRSFARLCTYRQKILADNGQWSEAAQSALTILRLARRQPCNGLNARHAGELSHSADQRAGNRHIPAG